jgi:hypothetical protein
MAPDVLIKQDVPALFLMGSSGGPPDPLLPSVPIDARAGEGPPCRNGRPTGRRREAASLEAANHCLRHPPGQASLESARRTTRLLSPSGSFTQTASVSRPWPHRPSTKVATVRDGRAVENDAAGRRPKAGTPPMRRTKEENPPATPDASHRSMTSLSVDETPCRVGRDSVMSGRSAANDQIASATGRALPQALRSQLPVIPDFSPDPAVNSGPLPRRRNDFM